ncbi:MAG: type II toxin-antitoxin system VapC family toxin, partial [Tumebacillaceae bacterium]
MNVLFDTNIYIYHTNGNYDLNDVFDFYSSEDTIVPTVQITELLGYYKLSNDPEMMSDMLSLIERAQRIIELDEDIATFAAELRREAKLINGKSLKTPDSILAATAILENALFIS